MAGVKEEMTYGVFVALCERNNHFWLVKHNYGERKWSLPGGGLEMGELVTMGAIREVKEETGFETRLVTPEIGIFSLKKSRGVVILFEGGIIGGSNNPDPQEISECRLFSQLEICVLNEGSQIYPAQFALINWSMKTRPEQRPVYGWLIPTQ